MSSRQENGLPDVDRALEKLCFKFKLLIQLGKKIVLVSSGCRGFLDRQAIPLPEKLNSPRFFFFFSFKNKSGPPTGQIRLIHE